MPKKKRGRPRKWPKDLPKDPRDYFIVNDCSIPELEELYHGLPSCSIHTLKRRCAQEKWFELRKKAVEDVQARAYEKTVEAVAEEEADKMVPYLRLAMEFRDKAITRLAESEDVMDPLLDRGKQVNTFMLTVLKDALQQLAAQGGEAPSTTKFVGVPGVDFDRV